MILQASVEDTPETAGKLGRRLEHQMKCRYCGQEIPEGVLYCENCGQEVRIVPDYNPLDDMLAQQIVGSINGNAW